jgi:hypothetical protein
MLLIPKEKLPTTEVELQQALNEYVVALENHKRTVGVPAPLPQFDILYDIVKTGGTFTVIEPPLKEPLPTPTGRNLIAEFDALKARVAALEITKG